MLEICFNRASQTSWNYSVSLALTRCNQTQTSYLRSERLAKDASLFREKNLVFKDAKMVLTVLRNVEKSRQDIVEGSDRANPSLVRDLLKIYAKFLRQFLPAR